MLIRLYTRTNFLPVVGKWWLLFFTISIFEYWKVWLCLNLPFSNKLDSSWCMLSYMIISAKVSHLKKFGGFVYKHINLFDISIPQRFSLEFKTMTRSWQSVHDCTIILMIMEMQFSTELFILSTGLNYREKV